MPKNKVIKYINNIENKTKDILDTNVIKSAVIDEIVALFNPDRCFFRVYDDERKMLFSCENEYLKNKDIGSITYYSYPREANEYYIDNYLNNEVFFIENVEKFIDDNQDNPFTHVQIFIKVLKEQNIKSFYGFTQYNENKCNGFWELQFTQNKTILSKKDIELVKQLLEYASTKLKEAECFELLKYTSMKEKTLRVLTDEILLIHQIDELFQYYLDKVVKLFKTDAALFIAKPAEEKTFPKLVYESFKDKTEPSMISCILPIECVKTYNHLIETFFPVVVNKTQNFYSNDKGRQDFYHKFNIESFMTTPLLTDDYPNIAIGGLLLMCHYPRIWLKNEIDLMRSMNDVFMKRLSQIKSNKEIENLRTSFIRSMSHDMRIPLLANAKTVELLLKMDIHTQLEEINPFIKELKSSIDDQYYTLMKYVEIYNYESKLRKLNLNNIKLTSIIINSIRNLKSLIDEKNIRLDLALEKRSIVVNVDEEEINKVVYNFLKNAVTYSPCNSTIKITQGLKRKDVVLCIQDEGAGIAKEIKHKLFDRSKMIKLIQRKIGSGLSLYHSKLIIEAHKGKIWYESSEKGTKFCFSLPNEKNDN